MSAALAPNPQQQQRTAEKRSAALASVVAAAAITLLKLITGLATASLGMISEAAHSGIDLIASMITFAAVNVADRPADEDHNYGHGKLESLSAGIEVIFMIASCVWIAWASIRRIVHHRHLELSFSIWPLLVLVLSIVVDYTRSRNLRRVAAEQHSEALEADALHFGTDIWSAAAVLLGLIATYVGERLHIPALEFADPIAALVVACIILYVTIELARRALDTLLDATPPEVRDKISRDLLAIDGILAVNRIRVRRAGANHFVDLTLGMPRNLTFQRSEQITFAANEAVARTLPGADTVIHAVPTATVGETVFDRIRAVAARSNLSVHDVSVQSEVQQDGGAHFHVEQHLELPEHISLAHAHEIATELENNIRREVPAITSLLTHIESEPQTIAHAAQMEASRNLEAQLHRTAALFPEILDVHEITVTRGHGGAANSVQVNCHVTMPDDLPMSRVHEVITEFESEFRLHHPHVSRVFIHPEPATDNTR